MIYSKIRKLADSLEKDVIETRHYFHRHPETSFNEVETTREIARRLREIGYTDVKTGLIGKPIGVVANLNSEKEGPCFALRADIDALPVQEETGLDYASENEGAMHACGHDSHIAILLTAAKVLYEIRDEIPGKVRLIFQPAEECGDCSGANAMIQEGVLNGVDAISGLHIWQPVPSGKVAYRSGPMMACSDKWQLDIQGQGGHGAAPHAAIDPTLAAGHFITMLQSIVSREINPMDTAVISVGKLEAGTGGAFNVIPDTASLVGTVRAFDPETRKGIPDRMRRIAENVSEAVRCKAKLNYHFNLPPTVNDPTLTELGKEVAIKVMGNERVYEIDPSMVAEDFSFYQEQIPGTFFLLGTGNEEKGCTHFHHHPKFTIDDDVLKDGVALLSSVAWSFLNSKKTPPEGCRSLPA